VEHLVQLATDFIDHAGYGALFLLMMLGNLGIPVGTEVVMPIAGAFVAKGHLSSIWLVGLVGTLGEVAGAGILYGIGYYGGHPFVARYGKYVGLSLHKLDIAHSFYERWGTKMVFVCRFIPIIRGIASLPAGISQMSKRWFFTYTAAGSAIFCFGLAALGNSLGNHIHDVLPAIRAVGYAVLALAVIGVVAWFFAVQRSARRRRAGEA
jgi:membrane protein DedA with SNARE-associated domain